MADRELPETLRKEIFQALVEAQDQGIAVSESKKLVAGRFGVTDDEVRQIERDGLDGQWPPL